MQTQKIQLTLTPEEITALSFKGKALGYNVTKYVKFLVMKEAYSVIESIPACQLSPRQEKKTLKAIKEYKGGKAKKLERISDLDDL